MERDKPIPHSCDRDLCRGHVEGELILLSPAITDIYVEWKQIQISSQEDRNTVHEESTLKSEPEILHTETKDASFLYLLQ